MSDTVGGVELDLSLNAENLNNAVSAAANQAKQNLETAFNQAASTVEKPLNRVSETVQNTVANANTAINQTASGLNNAVSNATNQVTQSLEIAFNKAFSDISSQGQQSGQQIQDTVAQTADGTNYKIQQILNDTERSAKSKAASIASVYKQQGMSQSEAMRKAWSQIERASKTSNESQTNHTRKSWSSVVKNSQVASEKIKNNFDGIKQKVQGSAESMKSSLNGAFKKIAIAATTAFSAAAVIKFGKECVENAASVSAANSQFAQTFGDLQSNAESAMQRVAKASGIVQSRLQGVGTSIYAFAKTTGMDSANALSMMEEALQVTADSAAYYDRSLEDTAESLKSFLKGNFENDAALGLSCTETTRNTAANKLYGKSFIELSESQKQLTLLQMVKDANQLSGALGQAARESDGWENVTGNLKESWNQLLAVIGKPILQVATSVVQRLSSAIAKLTEYAKGAMNALSELFNWDGKDTSNSITSAASSAQDLSSESESGSDSLDSVADSAEKAKRSVAGFDKLNILSDSSTGSSGSDKGSSSSTSTAGTATAPNVASPISNGVSEAFKNLYEKSGFKNFVDKVQQGINKVDWSSITKNCESIFKNAVPIARNYLTQVQKVGESAFGSVGSFIGGIVQVGGKQLQTLTGGVSKWLEKDKDKINGFITTIGNNFSKGFDNLSVFWEKSFDIIGQSVDRVRPRTEEAISNLLGGFTDFGGAVGTIVSEGFSIATNSLVEWIDNDGATIGEFFDNIQFQMADVMNLIGGIFSDIGTTLSNWWNGEGGSAIFKNICDMFTSIGTTLMNVYNEWIMPAWNFITSVVQSAWDNCLKPVFEHVWSIIGKIANIIALLWNNYLAPMQNWIVNTLAPVIKGVFEKLSNDFNNAFSAIGEVLGSVFETFEHFLDFITDIFAGDWDKAWQDINLYFKSMWDGMWNVLKTIVNNMIDGINSLWKGIYGAVKGIVDGLGGIAGAIGDLFGQDWHFSMPEEPPLIPKLAKGGIVKAPTLAVVGDNAGAGTGNPEVVAPLNKLQSMISTSNGEDVVILGEILNYLKRIYEMFIVFRNTGGNYYEFIAKLNGSEIFDEIVKQNELYKKRHGGKSAFA